MAAETMDSLLVIGANRGGQALTDQWFQASDRPSEVTILDRNPGRPETLAGRWREEAGIPAHGRVGAGELLPGDGARLEQWAVDDPASLAQGLFRPGPQGQTRQWSLQLATRIPLTEFSQPVLGLGGTVFPDLEESHAETRSLLDLIQRLTRRTTSEDITREDLNELMIRPVRREAWKENVRHAVALSRNGSDEKPWSLFVTRADVPRYPSLYRMAVELDDTTSRRQLRTRARERAVRDAAGLTFALASLNPDRARIYLSFLARLDHRDRWHLTGTMELPPPDLEEVRRRRDLEEELRRQQEAWSHRAVLQAAPERTVRVTD